MLNQEVLPLHIHSAVAPRTENPQAFCSHSSANEEDALPQHKTERPNFFDRSECNFQRVLCDQRVFGDVCEVGVFWQTASRSRCQVLLPLEGPQLSEALRRALRERRAEPAASLGDTNLRTWSKKQ